MVESKNGYKIDRYLIGIAIQANIMKGSDNDINRTGKIARKLRK